MVYAKNKVAIGSCVRFLCINNRSGPATLHGELYCIYIVSTIMIHIGSLLYTTHGSVSICKMNLVVGAIQLILW